MSKIYLLPNTKQYKANLHCHTTLSDGKIKPEDVVAGYKTHGYDILAITDHEYITNHQHMSDEKFIILTGYEISLYRDYPASVSWRDRTYCHLNLYAKNPYEDTHVCFAPKYLRDCPVTKEFIDTLKYSGDIYERSYDNAQDVIDKAKARGYIVCLNHPYWGMQAREDYLGLKGLFAMEVYNSGGSALAGYNSVIDQNLLNDYCYATDNGLDVAPIAADDNHNYNADIENSDSFHGFTMVCTDNFTYGGVIDALENHNFYASTGVLIKEASVIDGKTVHVECSDCDMILVYFGGIRWAFKEQNGITEADFEIPEGAKHIRIMCTSSNKKNFAITKTYKLQ